MIKNDFSRAKLEIILLTPKKNAQNDKILC